MVWTAKAVAHAYSYRVCNVMKGWWLVGFKCNPTGHGVLAGPGLLHTQPSPAVWSAGSPHHSRTAPCAMPQTPAGCCCQTWCGAAPPQTETAGSGYGCRISPAAACAQPAQALLLLHRLQHLLLRTRPHYRCCCCCSCLCRVLRALRRGWQHQPPPGLAGTLTHHCPHHPTQGGPAPWPDGEATGGAAGGEVS